MGRTFDLLRRAEANLENRQTRGEIFKELEFQLNDLGINEDQLSKQHLSEIRSSLTKLNACIKNPFSFLNLNIGKGVRAGVEYRQKILHTLLKLKRFALMRYDILVNREKCIKIRIIAKKINNQDIRSAIENSLYQLELKDQIVKKEYLKLDQIMA